MAMTFDIQISREKRFMQIATQLRTDGGESPDSGATTKVLSGSKVGSQGVGLDKATTSPPPMGPNELTALNDTSSLSLLKIDDIGMLGVILQSTSRNL